MTKRLKTALLAPLLLIAGPIQAVTMVIDLSLVFAGGTVNLLTLPLRWPIQEMIRTWRTGRKDEGKEG